MKPYQQSWLRLAVAGLAGFGALTVHTQAQYLSAINFGNPLLYLYAEHARPYRLEWGHFFSQLNGALVALPVALLCGAAAAHWLRLRELSSAVAAFLGWHLSLLGSVALSPNVLLSDLALIYTAAPSWVFQAGAVGGAWLAVRYLGSRVA